MRMVTSRDVQGMEASVVFGMTTADCMVDEAWDGVKPGQKGDGIWLPSVYAWKFPVGVRCDVVAPMISWGMLN